MENANNSINAENTQNTQNTAGTQPKEQVQQTIPAKDTQAEQPTEWLTQLDSLLNKRLDGVAKSILKSNGVEDNEISEIIKQYHESKTKATADAQAEHTRLSDENKALRQQLLDGQIRSTAASVANDIGLNSKYIAHALKLAKLDNVTADGKVNSDKLKEALKAVIDECDAFKITDSAGTDSGFKNVGAKQHEEGPDDGMAKIRRIMGLPEIKT